MVVESPFLTRLYTRVSQHDAALGGAYTLTTIQGETEVIGWALERSRTHLYHKANQQFIDEYQGILPLGNLTRWERKKDFKLWIDSIIYHSFLKFSSPGVQQTWMMREMPARKMATTMTIPFGFHAAFDGDTETKWILLKSGSQAWPVKVVNNVFMDGWLDFKRAHGLHANFKMFFGCERQWIFHVFVVGDDSKQIFYPWSQPNPLWVNIYPSPANFVTSALPSIVAGEASCAGFGHYFVENNLSRAVFQAHLKDAFRNIDLKTITIRVGICAWVIPVEEHCLDADAFGDFINYLNLQTLDYLFVSITNEAQLTVIVFDDFGAEKIFEWF